MTTTADDRRRERERERKRRRRDAQSASVGGTDAEMVARLAARDITRLLGQVADAELRRRQAEARRELRSAIDARHEIERLEAEVRRRQAIVADPEAELARRHREAARIGGAL
jgi:hypothetical protein